MTWPPVTSDPAPFRVGLLGYGTVGSAFAELLQARAEHVVRITGSRPELSGVLTRSRGDFYDIVGISDLIVELIGGVEPARDYVLRAMSAGRHVVTAVEPVIGVRHHVGPVRLDVGQVQTPRPIATGFDPHGSARRPEGNAVRISMRFLEGELRIIRRPCDCSGNNEE